MLRYSIASQQCQVPIALFFAVQTVHYRTANPGYCYGDSDDDSDGGERDDAYGQRQSLGKCQGSNPVQ
jgi:hypothetical protein